MSNNIYLYGASGHGKVVAEIAESLGLHVAGFIDKDPAIVNLLGYPVSTDISDGDFSLFISIGNNKIRKRLANELKDKNIISLVHPRSGISHRSSIGLGTAVMAGVTINSNVLVGEHCIINTNASVDHDCVVADYVHISPNAALAGDVRVAEGTHIGIGAVIIQGVRIGKWCTIGAGAVIIRDVPDGATVVGNPGRVIKVDNNISEY